MSAPLLPQAFPIDETVAPTTKSTDLLPIARALMKSPDVRAVLERVGVAGDFTDDEQDMIDRYVIAEVKALQLEKPQWDNVNIAKALARKAAAGQIDLDDDMVCLAFIDDKIRTSKKYFEKQPIRLSEVLEFLENLTQREDLLRPYQEARTRIKAFMEQHGPDEPYGHYFRREDGTADDGPRIELSVFAFMERLKYGLANRNHAAEGAVASTLGRYASGEIDRFDDPLVIGWLCLRDAAASTTSRISDDCPDRVMANSLIAQAFPINRDKYPTTKNIDVLSIAQGLVDAPETRAILERTGVAGDFNKDEGEIVDCHIIAQARALYLDDEPWDNLIIAQALARKAIAGLINIQDEAASLAFIDDRLRRKARYLFAERPIRLSEALEFLRNLARREDLLEPYKEERARFAADRKEYGPDHWPGPYFRHERTINIEPSSKVRTFLAMEMFKYGFANRSQAATVAILEVLNMYIEGEIERLDGPKVLHMFKQADGATDLWDRILDDLGGEQ